MREDEYNIVKINNEGRKGFGEFGKTQRNEFTSFGENKTSAKPNGLNDDHTKNESVIENTGLGEAPKYDSKQNEDLINQASNASTSTAATTTSASTAASTASTVSTTVATAASVVAVTTVAVTAGISVVTNNNASAELTKFRITSNQMTYALNLMNSGDDPFIICVENANYQSYRELQEGPNEGIFSGLKLGETYNVVVREDTLNAKVILEEVFTTYTNSEFLKFTFDQTANFKEETFQIKMDFEDVDDVYSDFEFYLEDALNPDINYTYQLDKVNTVQTLSTNIPDVVRFDLFKSSFNYAFTFKEDGDLIEYESGEVTFIDTTNSQVQFNSFEFVDNKANFLKYTFDVKLDFVDDLDRFEDFTLTMTDTEDSTKTQTFVLDKTTEVQTLESALVEQPDPRVNAGGDPTTSDGTGETEPTKQYVLDVRHSSFNYSFSYRDNGVLVEFKSGTIKFNDSTESVSEMRDVLLFKNADFVTRSFDVQLDFQDDFDYFDDISLIISRVGGAERETEEFGLSKDTEVHTCFTHQDGEGYMIDVRHGTYTAVLRYFSKEVNDYLSLDLGEFEFTDTSGAVSEIRSFSWDEKVNFNDLSFKVQLDMEDDLEVIDNIRLVVTETDEDNPGETKIFALEETNAEQDLNFNLNDQGEMVETSLDIRTGTFEYKVLYDYEGVEQQLVYKQDVQFYNSISSTFNTLVCDYNFYGDGTMYIRFDMDNEAGEYEQAFVIFTPAGSSPTAGDSGDSGGSGPGSNQIRIQADYCDTQWQMLDVTGYGVYSEEYYSIAVEMKIYNAKDPTGANPEYRTVYQTLDDVQITESDGHGHVYGGRASEYQSFSAEETDPIFSYTPYFETGSMGDVGGIWLRIETANGNTFEYDFPYDTLVSGNNQEIHLLSPGSINGTAYQPGTTPSVNFMDEIADEKPVVISIIYQTYEDSGSESPEPVENVIVTHDGYVFYIW